MSLFTPEELEEMRRADEEIEREFRWTPEELAASYERDRGAALDRKDKKARRLAERQKAYREANREKAAEYQKAYYEANREKVAEYQKAYREANREKVAEYQKAYREANREKVAERQKGAALRKLRRQAGYTQRALSRLSGVSQPTISQYETGAVPFDPAIFEPVFPGISRRRIK